MNVQEMLYPTIAIFLFTSPVTTDTTACGVFNFETQKILGGVIFLKETARVNITFSATNRNCSKTNGDIEISKYAKTSNIFLPHCTILSSCTGPSETETTCYCLEIPGFYTFTFIANRKIHSALWKFSAGNNDIQEALVTFNITRKIHVVSKLIIRGASVVPKTITAEVTTVKSTSGSLKSLSKYDQTRSKGKIEPIFPKNCKAPIGGPPEFFQNTTSINSVTIGPNDNITFSFRSHTSNISSCDINQTHKTDTNKFLRTVNLKCTNAAENASTFFHEKKHCLYSVTGQPPELLLTIQLRNLKRQDSGLWYVTVSNDEGIDEIRIRISVDDGIDPKDPQEIINKDSVNVFWLAFITVWRKVHLIHVANFR